MNIAIKPLVFLAAALVLAPALSLSLFLRSAHAEGRPFLAMFIEPTADGYALIPPDRTAPWQAPNLPAGEEFALNITATGFHVGDLPDIGKNDVVFQAIVRTDITTDKRLGDQGAISYSDGFRISDDMPVGGYTSRRLVSAVPLEDQLELTLKLHELDGAARKKYNDLGALLVLIEDSPSGASVISAPAGNIYLQLAMEVFNLVYGEMSKNDTILENPLTMERAPGAGVLPLRPGQWVFMEEAPKSAYKIDPQSDLTFDGRALSLTDPDSKQKMPTHIILSLDITPQPIPAR